MSKLYVANVTFHDHDFIYRLPGSIKTYRITIAQGSQTRLSGELTSDEITSVVEQHQIYGISDASKVDQLRRKVTLIYQQDRPISEKQLRAAIERNIVMLDLEGIERRKEAAIVVGKGLQAQDNATYKGVDVVVNEVDRDTEFRTSVSNIHVDRERSQGDSEAPVNRPKARGRKIARG